MTVLLARLPATPALSLHHISREYLHFRGPQITNPPSSTLSKNPSHIPKNHPNPQTPCPPINAANPRASPSSAIKQQLVLETLTANSTTSPPKKRMLTSQMAFDLGILRTPTNPHARQLAPLRLRDQTRRTQRRRVPRTRKHA